MNSLLAYLHSSWTNHVSAGIAAWFAFIQWGNVFQSVLIGVLIYIITNGLKWIVQKLIKGKL